MSTLEQYIDCMQRADNVGLASLFCEDGVLHDTSVHKANMDTLHLEGRMAIEMMFHHKFGFNRGPYRLKNVEYHGDQSVDYFIEYGRTIVPVTATLVQAGEEGKIKRLNIVSI